MAERILSGWQRRRLTVELARTDDTRAFRRILAILEVDRGRPISEVAQTLRVSRQSVHNWIRSVREDETVRAIAPILGDAVRSGRPPRWTVEMTTTIAEAFDNPPSRYGYRALDWTVPMLLDLLLARTGQHVSDRHLRRKMSALGYSWKRCRYELEPDPKREKKLEILKILRKMPPRTAILAEDETDILLFPPLASAWTRRGEPAKVRISGFNAKRVIFGTINILSGHRLIIDRRRQRAEDFCYFLEAVHDAYRGWHVAMILDEDPSHTAAATQDLAPDLNIELIWLPKRSPELNPMDHIWGHVKKSICANWQYPTIDEESAEFIRFVHRMSDDDALRKAGLHSPTFWLTPPWR